MNGLLQNPGLMTFAEALGEALGRGVARGINVGLSGANTVAAPAAAPVVAARRRGRPPKALSASAGGSKQRCTVDGCSNSARSKCMCSKHYQAERRRNKTKKG